MYRDLSKMPTCSGVIEPYEVESINNDNSVSKTTGATKIEGTNGKSIFAWGEGAKIMRCEIVNEKDMCNVNVDVVATKLAAPATTCKC
ncbi:hypothetical protein [Trichoplusia ni ascovirus 2c]|uniref:hypothetical protein n=1 Tax=Trichoplusia ni ascovirus 2c TaxID=328615 RepID=UPI0000E4424F|nr:hypothetical protein TNAV2c_gp119 [Trichoplusia ni ascovirus 2c]ABF70636.1 hypothetical protein [Trichoplusia ni ascovirus 2c]AUS94226.1 hypothetical protein [Trichoplusia ni ascovirus 6b]